MRTTLIYPGIAARGFNCLSQGTDAGWVAHGRYGDPHKYARKLRSLARKD